MNLTFCIPNFFLRFLFSRTLVSSAREASEICDRLYNLHSPTENPRFLDKVSSTDLGQLCKSLLGENEYFCITVRGDDGCIHKLFDPSTFFALTSPVPPICKLTLIYDRRERELIKVDPPEAFRDIGLARRPRFTNLGKPLQFSRRNFYSIDFFP